MKSRPWGRKGAPANAHRPRRLPHPPRLRLYSAPAFTLPPHTLRRRPRRLRSPAAAVIHNGLSTEKLSTSLLAALCKTFSPSRLRTRIYNISFARRLLPGSVRAAPEKSPRRCGPVSRAAVRRVGEGEGKGGRPLAQCPALSPPTAEPRPLVCRITVRKGGSAQGQPRPCPCVLPASARLRPCLRPLMGEVPCVLPASARLRPRPRPLMGVAPCVLPASACLRLCTLPADDRSAERRVGEGKGKGGRPSRSNPHLPAYRRAPAA